MEHKISNREKLVHQLFIGKISEIIGFEKVTKILKEANDAFPKGKFDFGEKVRFAKQEEIHPDLRNKDFCLIGFDNSAFALIEWEKRGQYHFEYYTGSFYADLELSV